MKRGAVFGKRGVSDVITTVLIILLVLAATAIIAGIILKNLGDASEKIESGFNFVSLSVPQQSVKVNDNLKLVNVNVQRGTGDGSVGSMNFILEDATGKSYVARIDSGLNVLESKNFDVYYNDTGLGKPVKVSVAPILKTSSGKDLISDPVASYKMQGNELPALPSGAVAYWTFDEGSFSAGGIIADSSGNGLNGKLPNSNLPLLKSGADCKVGSCVLFTSNSGSTGSIIIPNAPSNTYQEWSIVVWARAFSSQSKYRPLFSFNNPSYVPGVQFTWPSNPVLYPGWSYSMTSNKNISDGQWYHVAFVYKNSGNYFKIYVNGEDKSISPSLNGAYGSFSSTWVIGPTSGTYVPDQYVDEMIVFNRALTPEEAKIITK